MKYTTVHVPSLLIIHRFIMVHASDKVVATMDRDPAILHAKEDVG